MVCDNCSTGNFYSWSSGPTDGKLFDNGSYSNTSSNITSESDVLFLQEEVAEWLWKTLTPLVFLVGLFGNILIIIVMYRMKFWKKMTYFLLFILAFSDITVLCFGLIRRWIIAISDFDIRDVSDFGCRFQVFMIYFSMHFSSWTLVNITFERFLKTRDPFRKHCVDVSKILKFMYPLSIIFTTCIDGPLIFTNGLMPSESGPVCNNTSDEYYTYEEKYFVFIDLAWLSLIPFILMVIMNIFVGKTIRSSMRRRQQHIRDERHQNRQGRNNRKLTRMLFWTSIYFLIATMPASINFVFHTFLSATTTPSAQTEANLELSTAILYLFQFTNYSVNFYIYIKCKPSFRRNLPFGLGRSSSVPRRQPTISLSNTLRTSLGSSMTVTEDTTVAPESDRTDIYSRQNGNSIATRHSNTHHNHLSNEMNDDLDRMVLEGQVNRYLTKGHSLTKPLSSISSIAALVSGINIVSDNGGAIDVCSISGIDTGVKDLDTKSCDGILHTTYL